MALRLVPVRFLIAAKQRPLRRQAALSPALAEKHLRQVAWAVAAVARRSPVEFVCFPQSLAAHAMLARRGIATRLHYGASRIDGKLETHTWLEAGGRIVTGAEEARHFSALAVY